METLRQVKQQHLKLVKLVFQNVIVLEGWTFVNPCSSLSIKYILFVGLTGNICAWKEQIYRAWPWDVCMTIMLIEKSLLNVFHKIPSWTGSPNLNQFYFADEIELLLILSNLIHGEIWLYVNNSTYWSMVRYPFPAASSVSTYPGWTWLTTMSSLGSVSNSRCWILVRALHPIFDTR